MRRPNIRRVRNSIFLIWAVSSDGQSHRNVVYISTNSIGGICMSIKKVVCEVCGREVSKSNIARHLTAHSIGHHYDGKEKVEVVECHFCGKVCASPSGRGVHETYCKSNPNRKIPSSHLTDSIKGKPAWNRGLNKYNNESMRKISEKCKLNIAMNGSIGTFGLTGSSNIMNNPEVKQKHMDSMKKFYSTTPPKSCGRGHHGYYCGIWFDSTWELAYYLYCKLHNVAIVRNTTPFKYQLNGEIHSYYPDFYLLDDDIYVEIKGYEDDKAKEKFHQFNGNLLIYRAEEMSPILSEIHEIYGEDLTRLYETIQP